MRPMLSMVATPYAAYLVQLKFSFGFSCFSLFGVQALGSCNNFFLAMRISSGQSGRWVDGWKGRGQGRGQGQGQGSIVEIEERASPKLLALSYANAIASSIN